MGPEAEGQVRPAVPVDIERVGVLEDLGVPVGGHHRAR